jgi:hypothetical protein
MTIKSLLLGSAAAFVAVSGAQAADAIIVEPEPMEYVKVCDMYGAGYFYIPGTETCLKISGDVRVQYTADMYHNHDSISDHDATVRARVRFTANNETEYGTLGSDILAAWSVSDSNAPHDQFSAAEGQSNTAYLSKATINLAGFRTGFDNDGGAAWNRYAGYGYYNARASGEYSFHSAIFFEYGGSAGDFSYVVGIQDAAVSGSSGQPDIYAALSTSFGGLALGAAVVYDSNGSDVASTNGDGGIAYRIRADYDLSSMMPGASIGAWWEADNGETDYVKGHKWGVTMKTNLTEKMVLFAGYSAYDRQNGSTPGYASTDWTVGVRWNVVSGLYIQPEWNKSFADSNAYAGGTESSRDRFTLRIVRSF